MSATIVQRIAVILEAQASQYMSVMKQVESRTQTVVKNLAKVGAAVSLSITAPLTVLTHKATSAFNEYEAALSRMKGLVGLNSEEIAGFSEEIKQLAVVTGKAPVELAAAMENITSSGVKGKAALETLHITARAAAGGLGEVRSVSDTVTSAMNAYGVANLSATRATDILVAAVREGKAEASTFAPVLGNVLPIANEMGISFEEAAGSIAYLTLSTGSAATAATQYQNILAQVLKLNPKREGGKVLAQAGIDVEAFQKAVTDKGLQPALMDLKKSLGAAGLSLKDAFPDVQAMTAALQLTGSNADQAALVLRNVADAAGSVDTAFEAARETTQFGLNVAMAEMSVTMIELGEMVAPVMLRITNSMRLVIAAWNSLSKSSKEVVVRILTIVSAVGPLLVSFAGVLAVLPSIIAGFTVARTSMIAFALSTRAAAASLFSFNTVITIVRRTLLLTSIAANAMWLAITSPIGLVVASIALVTAAVAAVAYAIMGPEGIKAAWETAKAATMSFVNAAIGFMSNFSTNMQILWTWLGENWWTLLTDMGRAIVVFVGNAVHNYGVMVQMQVKLISAFIGWLTIAIPAAFNYVFNVKTWEVIVDFFTSVLMFVGKFMVSLQETFMIGLEAVTEVFSAWGKGIINIISSIATILGQAISDILEGKLPDPIKMMKDFAGVVAKETMAMAGAAGEKVVEATKKVSDALIKEGEVIGAAFDQGASDMNFANTATDIIKDGISQMRNPLDGFKSELGDLPEFVFSKESDAVNAAADAAAEVGANLDKGVDKIGETAGETGDHIDDVAAKAAKAAGAIDGVFMGSLESAMKVDEFMSKLQEADNAKAVKAAAPKPTTATTSNGEQANSHEGRVEKLLQTIADNTKSQFGPANLAS
jgi:TP901 family phage tail tape measure protein